MNKLRIVKAIVFLLTFLIIFGMILAGYTIYKKVQHPSQKQNLTINLNQPNGSHISDIKTSDNALYILITGGHQPDRIVAVRSSDLSVSATINLQ